MFFSHTRTILSINKGTICWTHGKVPKGELFGEICSKTWSEENLREAFRDISKRFSQKIRVVIGEEFAYDISFGKEKSKDDILLQIRGRIPEEVEKGWDFAARKADVIQVMAVQKDFFSLLQKISAESEVNIESLETEAVAICRQLPKNTDSPILFARHDAKILLGAAKNGVVLMAEVLEDFPDAAKIKEFAAYIHKRFGEVAKLAFISENNSELEDVFAKADIAFEKVPLDPMIGTCKKKHLRGSDNEILNIKVES